ncbi:hypothetical protein Q0Z83_023580 [Actinoplanes sichuanensis]|uniref:Uncharacterized protein n=1 Tax=Actinoplanes sichuanensis TaxID=512349 RepID=A0ABW4A263_9ACTN|nr:hypothetical protein [Actinoplanes sichuanensis]BEL04167.1 hypothetical protein Q0Z83_023580 [Actinoplanes sichuanensis]
MSAVEVADIRAHTRILNNLAYTEHLAGDLPAATLDLTSRYDVTLDDSTLR